MDCHALLQGIFWTHESNLASSMSPALAGRFFGFFFLTTAVCVKWDKENKDLCDTQILSSQYFDTRILGVGKGSKRHKIEISI